MIFSVLQKCQYRNHFYFLDSNATRSVLIEWSHPSKNFEMIYVYCPFSYIAYDNCQAMSTMYVKCKIKSGVRYSVTFVTFKSGYEPAIIQFTDIAPSKSESVIYEEWFFSFLDDSSSTSTTTSQESTVTTQDVSLTRTVSSTTTATSQESTVTTQNMSLTRTVTLTATATSTSSSVIPYCSEDVLLATQMELTRWRKKAIIAIIVAGLLLLVTIGTAACSIFTILRNR